MAEPELTTLKISRGPVIHSPVFTPGTHTRNWCAILSFDPIKVRTIRRDFIPLKPGTDLYPVNRLKLFSPLEFGSDWEPGTRHRERVKKRFYCVVTEISQASVTLQQTDSAASAVRLASRLRHSHRQAQLTELEQLRARILELESLLLADL